MTNLIASPSPVEHVTRRTFLRLAGLTAAVAAVLAACESSITSTAFANPTRAASTRRLTFSPNSLLRMCTR
ncbi:MAG: twin-arginine translocation signal domain-containing protein [Chloroflexi bacterium]|nr:twin-arginine translocation signal domain-containing protein [Chloroflexota bacterium]